MWGLTPYKVLEKTNGTKNKWANSEKTYRWTGWTGRPSFIGPFWPCLGNYRNYKKTLHTARAISWWK